MAETLRWIDLMIEREQVIRSEMEGKSEVSVAYHLGKIDVLTELKKQLTEE